ncbi:hypothetical protein Acsp04_52090 [Actinomadura sp. NBRC 104425]|nr:hypothetical protein Acsp04_52090 [Actinomadura sp. NBRC 104425]
MAFAEVLLAAGMVLGSLGVLIEALRRRRSQPASAPGMPVPPEALDRARLLLSKGRLIEAVKKVRKATSLGLVEAKQVVDALRGHQVP